MVDERFSIVLENARELQEVLARTVESQYEEIVSVAEIIQSAFKSSNKILICGNGGSAADSQHFAAELVSSFQNGLKRRALPVIALTTDTSILTAYSNDFGFDNVFVRQIEALGMPNDVVIVLTTSGKSANCINALQYASTRSIKTICFTSRGSRAAQLADLSLEVDSTNTQRIQEVHQLLYHTICQLIDSFFYSQ